MTQSFISIRVFILEASAWELQIGATASFYQRFFMPNTLGVLSFPASLDDNISLLQTANNAATVLSATIANNATTINVVSTAGFPTTNGSLTIEGEIIYYAAITSTSFTGCLRGRDSTVPTSHVASSAVELLIVSAHRSLLAGGLIEVEKKVGASLSTPVNGSLLQGTGAGTSAWNTDVFVAGRLGVGTAPNSGSKLFLAFTFTDASVTPVSGFNSTIDIKLDNPPTGAWVCNGTFFSLTLRDNGSVSSDVSNLNGMRIAATHNGTGTIASHNGVLINATCSSAGAAKSTNVTVGNFGATKSGAGTWNVTTMKILGVMAPSFSGGSITGSNLYGLYLEDFSSPGGTWTNKYALYVTGGTSYHAGRFGIGTTAPNSSLHVAGAIATALVTQVSNYLMTAADSVVLGDATASIITITLPSAVGIAGRQYTIVKTDPTTNNVVIATTSAQKINGSTPSPLTSQWSRVSVVSDNSNWVII